MAVDGCGRAGVQACRVDRLPFVSVVVPARNNARTIGACLDALMSQDYPKDRYEVIVVDRPAADRTADLVRRYPVAYVLDTVGRGPAAARNLGLQVARGEILAFTDADCVPSPSWLRCGAERFADGIGCVAGELQAYELRTAAHRYVENRQAYSQAAWVLRDGEKPFAATANAFYLRMVFDRIGAFDGRMLTAEDVDLAWRMQDQLGLRIVYSPEAVVFHQHRVSVRELLKQRHGYGYGWVQLYLKHREQLGRWTLKHTYWDVRALLRRIRRLGAACVGWARTACRGRHEPEPVMQAWIDVLCFLWWKAGQAQASWRYRVWHL